MANPLLPVTTNQFGGFVPSPASSSAAASSSSPVDEWLKRFDEAERLVADVVERIAERESVSPSLLPHELQRRTAEIRRKVAILETRLDMMQEYLSQLPNKQRINLRELNKLAAKLSTLSSKVKEVGAPFTMKRSSNRNELLGPDDNHAKVDVSSIPEMGNREIIELQKKVMKEQDDELDKLEESIVSTKHIALAINEELDLHTRLIDDLAERTDEKSNQLQRAEKRLKSVTTRMRKSGSCTSLLLAVIATVFLILVIWVLIV
ncbi:syntaxin-52-like [Oryza brachyantha]|uniref:syntaxin-52-like n=1 Tax=Oryza brachyantha TaxID=4533 RepID=UPI001AD97C1C|nr:syntaxin-52-like [Oryza brachyantha]